MNTPSSATLVVGALIALGVQPLAAQQEWSFEGERLLVTNLIGEVTVRGHDGDRIVVHARPGGEHADLIDFEVRPDGRSEFHTVFPLGQARRYHYPRMGSGRTRFSIHGWRDESSLLESIFGELSGRDRIEVSGRDRDGALEAWVDLEILVPRGVSTRVRVGVGGMEARDVEAPLDLDGTSGRVAAENIGGDLRVDTGSGSVTVGSVRGSLSLDTGSGSVEASDIDGERVHIDTGSGSVRIRRVSARRLEIDTGSGSVHTTEIDAGSSLIDTGSGSVTLDLLRLDGGDHTIDTGSGRVRINIPEESSVRIHAETGSGGISLDLPPARLHKVSRDEIDLEIGDGRARLMIDTGSGGVTIQKRTG